MTMNHPLLKATALKKTFYHPREIHILNGVDINIESGSSVAIMGRSGQGKSTLLQILGTLDSPCDGSLEIAGTTVTRYNKSFIRNKRLAFIFQSFHLLDDYTALENVLMPARIDRQDTYKGSKAYQRGMDLLDRVGLKSRAEFPAKFLSGGEKQRVAIARALCNDPSLILADEPSGNLDHNTSLIIHQLLLEFSTQPNKALIVVTHDESLANQCNVQYTLENGCLYPTSPSCPIP